MHKIIDIFLKFNKSLLILSVLTVFIALPNAVPAQSPAVKKAAQTSWNAFWVKFSRVVKDKDRKGLAALTSKNFFTAGGDTLDTWFDGTSWREIQRSVNRGTMSHGSARGEVWRITRDKTLLFVFKNNRWRFYGEFESS